MDGFVLLVIIGGGLLVGLVGFFGIRAIVRQHRQSGRRKQELTPLVQRLGWKLRELDAEADQEEIEGMLRGTSLHALIADGCAGFDLMASGMLDGHETQLFDVCIARSGSLQTPAQAALMLLSPEQWTAVMVRPPRPLPRFYLQPEPLASPIGDLVGSQAAEEFVNISPSQSSATAAARYRLDAHRSELGPVGGLLEHPIIKAGSGCLVVECTGDRLLVHDPKCLLSAADIEQRVRAVTSLSSWLAGGGRQGS